MAHTVLKYVDISNGDSQYVTNTQNGDILFKMNWQFVDFKWTSSMYRDKFKYF